LGGSLFLQSSVKHLLTQGDSILIAALSNLQDQGAYALASNYGGLIARMLFQPIEESSRTLFSTLLSSTTPKRSSQPQAAQANIPTAVKILTAILRLYVLFSLIAASIGPTLAPQLLNLVAGSRWASSGAGDVLATYCYYIPALAINGVSEAFISSVATSSELRTQSIWMFAFSLGFASAGYVLLRVLQWGAQGLVWANIFNMLLRILWSAAFIQRYLRRQGTALDVGALMPSMGSLAVGVAAAAALKGVKHSLFVGGVGDLLVSAAIAGPAVLLT
jgi:oligosaccharide translocation protein RFT1